MSEQKQIPPYVMVGLVKFAVPREIFSDLAAQLAVYSSKEENKEKFPFDFDQMLLIGTVDGEIIQELRFIKFIQDEQQTVLQADNGDSGQ